MTAVIISAVSFIVVAILAGVLRGVGKKLFDHVWKKKVEK